MAEINDAALSMRPTAEIARLRSRAFVFAAIGALVGIVAFIADPNAPAVIMQSYLIAYMFWLGITLGSLAVLMIQHLTGGAWTYPSRRILEASTWRCSSCRSRSTSSRSTSGRGRAPRPTTRSTRRRPTSTSPSSTFAP
jgi:hypothetical protein